MDNIVAAHITNNVFCSVHPDNQSLKIQTSRGYIRFNGCEAGIKCKKPLIHNLIPELMNELENGYVEYNKLKNDHIEALKYINYLQNCVNNLKSKNKELVNVLKFK